MERTALGAALYDARMGKKLSTEKAAREVECSVFTFHRWEAGKTLPSDLYLDGIARFLGKSRPEVEALVTASRTPEPPAIHEE